MSDQLIRAALRVRFCVAFRSHQQPRPADVERLRQAVSSEERKLNAYALATRILQRETERRVEGIRKAGPYPHS
jgi:hypothetical protein